MCNLKDHPLVEIYRTQELYGAADVVRWCPDCGAIVVDTDVDNRIQPGRVMGMKFPEALYESIKKKRIKNGSNH